MEQPSTRRRRRRPGENRERLIEAGITEFARLGYRAASTAGIARLADVPQPHVYASFETKRELFLACLDRAAERLVEDPSSKQAREPRRKADRDGRMLFQSFAAVEDPDMSNEVSRRLESLLSTVGEKRLRVILSDVTEALFH